MNGETNAIGTAGVGTGDRSDAVDHGERAGDGALDRAADRLKAARVAGWGLNPEAFHQELAAIQELIEEARSAR